MRSESRQPPPGESSDREVKRLSEKLKRQVAHAKQRISQQISLMEDRSFDPPKDKK